MLSKLVANPKGISLMKKIPYPKRILLKLSGEILAGNEKTGIHPEALQHVALALKKLHASGLEIGIVIGGGNIFRGSDLKALNIAQTPRDHIGMLATLMNGIALQQALSALDVSAVTMSGLECPKATHNYQWTLANQCLKNKQIVLFVGGTGNPYFTTDSAAALRASEIGADMLLKATKVDGIYNKDPVTYPDAVKYNAISYAEVLAEKLKIMDATAIALCQSNDLPIYVFNMQLLFKKTPEEILGSNFSQGTLVINDK